MSLLLPSFIFNASRPHYPFILLESSVTQSCLSVLRAILEHEDTKSSTLLFCFLYPPSSLVNNLEHRQGPRFEAVDQTASIPGYCDTPYDPGKILKEKVESAPAGPLTVVIDSIDTLCADLGSASKCYAIVSSVLSVLQSKAPLSRLIIHANSPTPVLPLLIPTQLSPSLAHVIAHPPIIIKHIAETHLVLPPPSEPPERFWRIFSPIVARDWEVEHLVYGANGPGSSSDWGEIVLEIATRGQAGLDGKRRGSDRFLEGWSQVRKSCELTALESLRTVWTRTSPSDAPVRDPAQNLSFNLNLTPGQKQSRANVPLPYVHDGSTFTAAPPVAPGTIYYDPDSADDIDDDDPDEDLDI